MESRPANSRDLRAALGLFITGSLVLLAWALVRWLVVTTTSYWNFFYLLPFVAYPALLLHLGGWIRLWRAVRGTTAARWPYYASIAGFVIGFALIPWTAPRVFFPLEQSWSVGFYGVLAWPMFPYLPTVFGPVIVAHATIYSLLRSPENGLASLLRLAGVATLVLVAGIGLVIQFLLLADGGYPEPWFFALSGVTSLGYLLVLAGMGSDFAWRFDAAKELAAAGPK